jgi:hypothetical protein
LVVYPKSVKSIVVAAMAGGMSSVSRLPVAPRRTTAHEEMLVPRTGFWARTFAPDDAAHSFVASFPIGCTDRI